MRVLYIDHTSTVSGAQRALLDLLEALPASVSPVLACPAGQLWDLASGRGVPCLRLTGTAGSFRLHPRHSARAVLDVGRSARELNGAALHTRADVVHANSIRAGMMAGLARPLGLPPSAVHIHDVLPDSLVANAVRRSIHATADAIITISRHTTQNFAAGRSTAKYRMLHNPLDTSRFHPGAADRAAARAALGLAKDQPLIGLVAQITPWKGQDTAIAAMRYVREAFPDAKLLIVGTAKFVDQATRFDNRVYGERLRSQVAGLGLEQQVEFWPEREDVDRVLAALDVAVAPSWDEPFGRSVVEAMAMGRAVVATNVGGPAEYIDDGVDGLLVGPRDPQALGAAVAGLLGDAALRQQMGSAAATKAVHMFDRSAYARRVVDVYDDIVALRPGRGTLGGRDRQAA